jgi:hypothetical protein
MEHTYYLAFLVIRDTDCGRPKMKLVTCEVERRSILSISEQACEYQGININLITSHKFNTFRSLSKYYSVIVKYKHTSGRMQPHRNVPDTESKNQATTAI